MSQAHEVPEYEVLQRSFFAPHTVEPGTRILYEGEPGDHLRPLNAAAERMMEVFYSKEFPEHDPRTRQPTGKFIATRAGKRPPRNPGEAQIDHGIVVTATPVEDPMHLNIQSLAEIAAARKPTDQRPPGLKPPPSEPVKIETSKPEAK